MEILHQGAIIIGACGAVIAAVSSLKNGRTLNGGLRPKVEDVHAAIVKPPKRKTPKDGWERGLAGQSEDWYKPPDV